MCDLKDLDILKAELGWKDEWNTNKDIVVSVDSASFITKRAVLTLVKYVFASARECFCFLERVIPLGYSLPDLKRFGNQLRDTKMKREKLLKKRSKGEQFLKEYQDFLLLPFFPNPSNSSVSCLCSPQCMDLRLQLEILESEKIELIDQE